MFSFFILSKWSVAARRHFVRPHAALLWRHSHTRNNFVGCETVPATDAPIRLDQFKPGIRWDFETASISALHIVHPLFFHSNPSAKRIVPQRLHRLVHRKPITRARQFLAHRSLSFSFVLRIEISELVSASVANFTNDVAGKTPRAFSAHGRNSASISFSHSAHGSRCFSRSASAILPAG